MLRSNPNYEEMVVAFMAKPIIGIQMYTFRDLTKDDLPGTLKQAAEIGYQAVEFAGFFGHSAKEVRKVLDDNGLKAPSAHIGLNHAEPDKLESDLQQQIEYAQELGGLSISLRLGGRSRTCRASRTWSGSSRRSTRPPGW